VNPLQRLRRPACGSITDASVTAIEKIRGIGERHRDCERTSDEHSDNQSDGDAKHFSDLMSLFTLEEDYAVTL
jgi:hypothetical protein